ncbi:uncharacterized protein LOC131803046 [Musca domestica]|uniref:Uncharacterized protein LOC101888837 n=1 Tax=Musca domestica TaxID=7370 RepID=A0A1I8MSI3_MUSDO|nr:uncharacterized protein LOC101888837 [Musca domestica]XP_058979937.1 uncharacterized protein LOC131803046 [Musca domestica]
MVNTTMQEWMSNEMERLSLKWERYKPACSGYNRIHSVRLSKSVTHMLNNPLPAEDRLGGSCSSTTSMQRSASQTSQVLSRSPSSWEEVYPTVRITRQDSEGERKESAQKFAYYRNCSTRVT